LKSKKIEQKHKPIIKSIDRT